MLNFLSLMLLPLAISIFILFYFKRKVTLGEFGMQIGIIGLFIMACLGISYWQNTTDVELWNGMVSGKSRDKVSCSHSYSCNCRTVTSGSGKNQTTSTVCDTCYEHLYDVDWNVQASTGESVGIDRVDRQGLDMPPRWGAAFVGEPFTSQHRYTNYILANPDSVLLGGKGDVEKFKALIPDYPVVTDYYRANHFINMGVPGVNFRTWNWLTNEANKTLGTQKQVNLLILLVHTDDPRYTLALKDKWVGGKKNDAVLVIGSLDGHKIEFADVISWTPKKSYIVELRDAVMRIGTLDQRDQIVQAAHDLTAQYFERMHMSEYKYLLRSFQPSGTAMWVIFILATGATIGLSFFFVTNDVEDYEGIEQGGIKPFLKFQRRRY